jgi:hypothetical protein
MSGDVGEGAATPEGRELDDSPAARRLREKLGECYGALRAIAARGRNVPGEPAELAKGLLASHGEARREGEGG